MNYVKTALLFGLAYVLIRELSGSTVWLSGGGFVDRILFEIPSLLAVLLVGLLFWCGSVLRSRYLARKSASTGNNTAPAKLP